ncbi:metal-dependent hydrolase [Paenibacillus sp. MWE-103]|uniref:Metal-dependent hydrolase n=1 Tax=Paenibacillus artemisiicola TaxID=1172618 RepID=A0ABS3WCK5_9BACL|nr:metal-dependent hydrolase [Paenibacillus artemisiicola]MBO7746043.1 metal-dependent hydrolase [Paenibacillus artemisiicola]
MDTGSHLLFGVTLAGLAMADPAVAAHPELQHAVLAATLLGSHAPDFDSVMRLRGPSAYIRHHRGLTHSLPAPLAWAPLLGFPIAWLCGAGEWSWTVVLWTLFAVCFHIVLDLFNAYGVQCLRPITRKWLHLDALPLFDPYLFAGHAAAALLWLSSYPHAVLVFMLVYALTAVYLAWRLAVNRVVLRKLAAHYGMDEANVTMLPTLLGASWQYVADLGDEYATGYFKGGRVDEAAQLPKAKPESLEEPAKATMAAAGVRAFHHFSERVHVKVQEVVDGYLVTWSDVRFWHQRGMPFSAAVTLDRNLNVLSEQIGWNKKSWQPPFV